MKIRFSLFLVTFGLTVMLVGQKNSGGVLISVDETVPVFEHCEHIEEVANA